MDLAALCLLPCHTPGFSESGRWEASKSLLPPGRTMDVHYSAKYVANSICSMGAKQWQEETILWRQKAERNVPNLKPGLPWKGPSKAIELHCMSVPWRPSITKHWRQWASNRIMGWHVQSVIPQSLQHMNVRFAQTKLIHLKCTLTLKNKTKKHESCIYFRLLFFSLFLIYVVHYLKRSVFVYTQYELICKNNVW